MGKKRSSKTSGIILEPKISADIRPKESSNQQKGGPPGDCGTISIDIDIESPLEKLLAKATDQGSLRAFAEAWHKLMTEKRDLRTANIKVSYEEFDKLISSKKLDSNLKKCTAFVRKMKQFTASQKSSMESDLKTLNLTKYLSEIAGAVVESRFKIGEIVDIITVCSWIHQRYSDFATILLECYTTAFPSKEDNFSPAVLSKLSVDLRMLGDLTLCGIIPLDDGYSLISSVIQSIVDMDKKGKKFLMIILSFCRGLGDDFLGVIPRSISKLCEKYSVSLNRSEVYSAEQKNKLRVMVKEYFTTAVNTMLKLHKEVRGSEMHNRRLLKTRGEIHPDRKSAHLAIMDKFEKYHTNLVKFSDLLNEDLPEVPSLPADSDDDINKIMLLDDEQYETVPGIVIFDDEETRSFYQDFPDLKVYLPPKAYREIVQQAEEQTQAIEEREKALAEFSDEALEVAELKNDSSSLEEEDKCQESEELADSDLPPSMRNEETETDIQIKPNFLSFLDNLPNCVNRNMIDKAAVEFADCHNNKGNRKKLVQALFRVSRQRTDLLSLYSRFVAILAPVMPDIGLELCQLLKEDFRYLVRKKHQTFVATKLKITRFIAELVNFKIFPKSDALQCLKILLLDFVHHQVEMAAVFVETCGRFLYRTPASHRRMKIYLDEMIRKKMVKSFEPRYVSMIDHAYFLVCPPDCKPRTVVKKPPLEAYLEYLLFDNLCKESFQLTVKQLNMLDCSDDKVLTMTVRYLTQPWRVTYQQLPYYAKLILKLRRDKPEVVQNVVDTLLEDIRRGLERFAIGFNHRRLSSIRFLSELYDLRVVGSSTIFDTLYMLITYGTSVDIEMESPIDPSDNLFRIRLACQILQDSGECLTEGYAKRKLKCFLKYLQRYFWFKKHLPVWETTRFPYATQELWEDVMTLVVPKAKLAKSFEEAKMEVEDMEKILKEKLGEEAKQEIESANCGLEAIEECDEQDGNSLDGGSQNSHTIIPLERNVQTRSINPEDEEYWLTTGVFNERCHGKTGSRRSRALSSRNHSGNHDSLLSSGEPYDSYEAYECAQMIAAEEPEDLEFIAMFDKLCSEVNHAATRDGGKHMKADIPIPLQIRSEDSTSGAGAGDTEGKTAPVVLITRKGNKQRFNTLSIPSDCEFLQKIKSREEAERSEKEKVKMRTLEIRQLQEQEERDKEQAALRAAQRKGTVTFNIPFYS